MGRVLEAARASLREPSRPQTPADDARRLFTGSDYGANRPSSSYGLPRASHFVEKPRIAKLRPLAPVDPPEGPRPPRGGPSRGGGGASTGPNLQRSLSGPPSVPPWGGGPEAEVQPQPPALPPTFERPRSSSGLARPRSARVREQRAAETGQGASGGRPPPPLGLDGSGRLQRPSSARGLSKAHPEPWGAPGEGAEGWEGEFERGPAPQIQRPQSRCGHNEAPEASWGGASGEQPDYSEEDGFTISSPPGVVGSSEVNFLSLDAEGEATALGARGERGGRGAGGAVGGGAQGEPEDPRFIEWRLDTESILVGLGGLDASHAGELSQGCEALHTRVDRGMREKQWLAWLAAPSTVYSEVHGGPISMKDAMVEHMARLMDSQRPELMLKAGVVVIKLSVGGSPALVPTLRVLLKLSKEARFDVLFRRERSIVPLLSYLKAFGEEGNHSCGLESLVYAAGVLKNITNEEQNQRALFRAGAAGVLTGVVMKACACAQAAAGGSGGNRGGRAGAPVRPRPGSQADLFAQVCVQSTGALRNLVVASVPDALEAPLVSALSLAAGAFQLHQELMLNIARIVSKLSQDEGGCYSLSSDKALIRSSLRLLQLHQTDFNLSVRLAYMLGNLTTTYDSARLLIGFKLGGLDTLTMLLRTHVAGAAGAAVDGVSEAGAGVEASSGEPRREDVIVKLLRVVANLGMHRDVGKHASGSPDLSQILLALLSRYSMETSEEVVLNAVAALTNLSFYDHPENIVLERGAEFLPHMAGVLLSRNTEAVVEAARACGNLSRREGARAALLRHQGLEALCLLLGHAHRDVVFSAAGALINLGADGGGAAIIAEYGGFSGLAEALEGALGEGGAAGSSRPDARIVAVCCQALFNLLAHYPKDRDPLLTVSDRELLQQILRRAVETVPPPPGSPSGAGGPAESLVDLVAGLDVRADPTLPDDLEPLEPPVPGSADEVLYSNPY